MADEPLTATDGTRKFTLRVLDPADTLDLLEAAGDASSNAGWVRYAMAVCSVAEIDGVPVPMPANKDAIRAQGRRLGNVGFAAIAKVLFGSADTESAPTGDATETAKN